MNNQLITLDDRTSSSLTPTELFNVAWSLNYQAVYHYGRSPWVEHGYAPPAHVSLLPKGVKPPVGAWNIILLDTSDVEGALGYHEDAAGTEIPFSEVFVQTAREDGVEPSEVASHEMLEMLVDPDVNQPRKVLDPTLHQWYSVEVGDPVQGCGYDVGAPEGRPCGVTVADFAYPLWWKMAQTRPDLSFRDSVKAPFALAAQGYISVAPESEPENWGQIFGQDRNELPKWASRLPRIHGL